MSADVASPTATSPDSFTSASPSEPVSRGFVDSRGDPEDSHLLPSPASSVAKSSSWPPPYAKDAKEAMEKALAAEPKMARFWRTVMFVIQAACTFVGCLLLNVLQVAIFPLRFVDMGLFRTVDEIITRSYAPVMTMIFEKWSGAQLIFYGSQEFWQQKGPENAIVISNHASFSDWPVMFMIAERKGFATRLRVLIKEAAKYVPGIGWGCWLHEMIFVRKNWTRDGPVLTKKIADFRNTRSNIWIALFPEGTFVDDKSRHLVPDSERFCQQKGLPILRHVLLPRVKGFTVLCDALRGHVSHIVDFTMVFEGCQNPNFPQYNTYTTLGDLGRVLPEISAYLNGLAPSRIHVYIRTYPMDEVPALPEQTERWLIERFQEKEQLLTYFHENGKFPGDATQRPLAYPRLLLHSFFQVLFAFAIVFGISKLSAFALTVATAGGVIFLAAALLIQSRVHAE